MNIKQSEPLVRIELSSKSAALRRTVLDAISSGDIPDYVNASGTGLLGVYWFHLYFFQAYWKATDAEAVVSWAAAHGETDNETKGG